MEIILYQFSYIERKLDGVASWLKDPPHDIFLFFKVMLIKPVFFCLIWQTNKKQNKKI